MDQPKAQRAILIVNTMIAAASDRLEATLKRNDWANALTQEAYRNGLEQVLTVFELSFMAKE